MNFPPKQESLMLDLADTELMYLHFKEELDGLRGYLEET